MFYVDPPPAAGGGGGDAGAAAAAAAAAAGGGATPAWYDGFENKEVQGWVKAYGNAYPNPEAMATKAWNLERLVGADKAGKAIIVPDFAKAKPEEARAFWNRVGAGDKQEAYKVPDAFKDDVIMQQFAQHAFKVGMPLSHFAETAKWYEGAAKAAETTRMNAFEKQAGEELTALFSAWGDKKDENIELGRRAAQAFLPHKDAAELETILNKMEGALGSKLTLGLWAAIGRSIGEHGPLPDGGNMGQIGEGGMTPEGARVRIAGLKADKEWRKKFAAGDVDANAEWTKLHAIGYPDAG